MTLVAKSHRGAFSTPEINVGGTISHPKNAQWKGRTVDVVNSQVENQSALWKTAC